MNNHYDAIVIGSGIGGLTAAAILAKQQKKRVLVLERHWLAGGQTHAFKRKGGYSWDVGLHYVGDMAPGSDTRVIMDYITNGQVQWELQPGGVDEFHYPDLNLHQGNDFEQFRNKLELLFPKQKKGIASYFQALERAQQSLKLLWVAKVMPPFVSTILTGWARFRHRDIMGTTQAWLDHHIDDPKLQALLTSQWGDYGLTPDTSAFLTHALIVNHYRNGAWYPVGGARRLAEAIVPIIEENGGKVQVQTTVNQIVVEDGCAVGVDASRFRRSGNIEESWRAPQIFSAIGAYSTYHNLLREQDFTREKRESEALLAASNSAVTLYLGLKEDPAKFGFTGVNHWMYRDFNHNQNRHHVKALLNGEIYGGFLSFPSMKDRDASAHTAEVVVHCPWDAFAEWNDKPWRHRGQEYEILKKKISQGILDLVEEFFPGFHQLVDYHELSTPVTLAYFTNHPKGSFYGLPGTPERYKAKVVGPRTPVKNCYLAGTDAASMGIVGAMMGGIMGVSSSMGMRGFPEVMGKIINGK